jgi:hypothetical protein
MSTTNECQRTVNSQSKSIDGRIRDRDDGVGPLLELDLDLRTRAAVGASTIRVVRRVVPTSLSNPAVQDHLDGTIAGEAVAKIRI